MSVPPGFPKHRLALCMIVRDEAERLPRCLASVAPWVGEIVVVDTGSTDDTVAIAEAHGAKVVHFPWVDDFAAARNAGLDAATAPWALVLDADEWLEVPDASRLAAVITQREAAACSTELVNVDEAGEVVSVMAPVRLYERAIPTMRYRGALHEQLAAIADRQVKVAHDAGVRLYHDGYTARTIVERGKLDRNLRLARAHVKRHPDDPHAWYVLGISVNNGDTAERIAALERAIAGAPPADTVPGRDTWIAHAYIMLIRDSLDAGEVAKARAHVEDALQRFPTSPDLLLTRGGLRQTAGDGLGAEADYRAVLTPAARAFRLKAGSPEVGEIGARISLATVLLDQGREAEAEAELRAALAATPEKLPATGPMAVLGALRCLFAACPPPVALRPEVAPAAVKELARWFVVLLRLERYDDVEAALARGPLLGPVTWEPLRRAWGVILARAGATEVGLHLLLQALEAAPDDPDLFYWLGHCAEGQGQPDDARVMWQACLDLAPDHPQATRRLATLV